MKSRNWKSLSIGSRSGALNAASATSCLDALQNHSVARDTFVRATGADLQH